MTPNRGSTKYPEQLQKFVDTIERKAQASGRSVKEARLFGAWSACYVRYCTMQNRDWKNTDNALPFLKYLKETQEVGGTSLRRAAEGLLFVFEEMMNRSLGDIAWRPPPRAGSEQTSGRASGRPARNGASSSSPGGAASASSSSASSASPSSAPSNAPDESQPDASTGASSQSSMLTRLLFHTSLPIHEAMDLRAGDVDFDAGMIYISDAMGTPKRIVEIPDALVEPLHQHVKEARDDYPGQPLDAPLFQANALQGRTADESEIPPSDAPDEAEDDLTETSDSRPSLWHYAGS